MSVSEIHYNADSKRFELVVKFFLDDMEHIIEEINGKSIFLGTEKQDASAEVQIKSYCLSHIKLFDKDDVNLSWIGMETDQDYLWVYIESEPVSAPDELRIYCDFFLETFKEQSNHINYTIKESTKSATLHKDLKEVLF